MLPDLLPQLLPNMLPNILKDVLANPARSPELTCALRAALLGPFLPLVAGTTTTDVIPKYDSSGVLKDTDAPVKEDSSGNVSIGKSSGGPYSLKIFNSASAGRLGQDNDGFFFASDTNGKVIKLLTQSNNVLQEWMRITAGGQIGMGTASPGAALHLSQQDASFLIDGSGTHSVALQGPSSNGRFGQDGEGMFLASDTNGKALKFLTSNGALNEWIRITSAGKVGIGTTVLQTDLTLAPSKMEAFEIATPGTPVLSAVTATGGALSGTYYYKIAALDSSGGQTLAGAEASVSSVTSAVMLKWTPVAGASAYRVYRGTSSGSENVYTYVPATPGGTQAYPDTGATLAGSGTPPSSINSFAAPAPVAGSSTGSLTTSNPYWYTIAALDASNSVLAVSAESVACQLVSGQSSIVLTWTPYVNANLAKYRIYRATLVSSVKTYSSGYYEVPVAASLSNSIAFADIASTGLASGSPATTPTAYIVKTGDAQITTTIPEPTVASVRAVEQLLPGRPQAGSDTYGAGIYAKVDMQNQPITAQMFAIYGELLNQADGAGGFMKIAHSGHGDAIFVPLYGSAGVALEAASNVDGTKGIISTLQGSYPNSTLFNALWAQATLPGYGMYFADQSYGNALVIRKRGSGADESATQIRLVENDVSQPPSASRERFGVFSDGSALLSSVVHGGAAHDSPALRLRGTSTTGDLEMKLQNVIFGSSSDKNRLSIKDNSGVEKAAVTNGGELWVKSHSGYADSESKQFTGAATTTDGTTPQTIASIALSDAYAYYIVVKVVGRKSSGGDFVFFNKAALAYRQGGSPQFITVAGNNSTDIGNNTPIKSSGATAWSCDMTASSNNVLVRVTGQVSTTIYWSASIEYQAVSTSS